MLPLALAAMMVAMMVAMMMTMTIDVRRKCYCLKSARSQGLGFDGVDAYTVYYRRSSMCL